MKGHRINFDELIAGLNKYRMEHQSKSYTRGEILDILHSIGFNKATAPLVASKLLSSESLGKAKLYGFPSTPIHRNQIIALYEKYNKNNRMKREKKVAPQLFKEDVAIEMLREAGYQVRKCIGFDLEKFRNENPVLYKKYLKYEIV